MEYIIGLIILYIIGRSVYKILPTLPSRKLFPITVVVLLIWVIIQETSKWGIYIAIAGAFLTAWKFTKWIKSKE